MTETQTLLADYVSHRSEAAFRELVARYINLVHSTAKRCVGGDTHFAQDVTQTVFLNLSRKAQSLPPDVTLGGWLHRDTCHVAATLMRGERRRQNRERKAMETTNQQDHSEANLAQVTPLLDEAINQLGPEDRQAILLRFFEQQGLRALGEAMGISENAAQKRVGRALDELRVLLERRGVALSVTALGSVLAVEAVTAAPAGLVASVAGTAFAGAATASGPFITLLKLSAMTKVQTGVLSLLVLASVTAPVAVQYQAQAKLREKDDWLRQQRLQLAKLAADNKRLASLLAHTKAPPSLPYDQFRELLRLRGEIGRLNSQLQEQTQSARTGLALTEDGLAARQKVWAERIDRLKQWLAVTPPENIPEIQFLTDREWLDSIYPHTLDSTDQYAQAMSAVRNNAQLHVLDKLHAALRQYAGDNNGQFPSDISQLKPYLDPSIDDAILQRYEILPSTSLVPELQDHGARVITQKAPVNAELDVRFATGLDSGGMADSRVTNRWFPVR